MSADDRFVFGPLNKSIHTQMFELLCKCLAKDSKDISFHLKPISDDQSHIIAQFGSQTLNVTNLLQKVNFNHVSLTKTDSEHYMHFLYDSNEYGSWYGNHHYLSSQYQTLSQGEIQAIKSYSGSAYYTINSVLYGNTEPLTGSYDYIIDNNIDSPTKALMLNIGFLSSGLNNIMPDVSFEGHTYRGEHHINFDDIQHRIAHTTSSLDFDCMPAFMSTSGSQDISSFFSQGSMIVFDHAYGKDISGLSHFPQENEYLLPPGQIKFESYEYKNGTYYFKARVIVPLEEGKDVPTENDIQQFQELIKIAEKNNISLDFISEHNSVAFLNDKHSEQALDLNSILQDSTPLLFSQHPTNSASAQTPSSCHQLAYMESHFASTTHALVDDLTTSPSLIAI